jgi:hypothetical protein
MVFIDEIGRESQTGNLDHARFALSEIANKCCYQQRFLVMSTNMKSKEFPKYLEGNMVSRFSSEYCKYIEEPFDQDLRSANNLFE